MIAAPSSRAGTTARPASRPRPPATRTSPATRSRTKAFGTACRLAGITGLRWHDLRHTFGTRMAEAGCSEATIADLMGHFRPVDDQALYACDGACET
ncbi:MAG: tyrosine-type recombinase/integrase [Pyrinomonadaceae bacterium]